MSLDVTVFDMSIDALLSLMTLLSMLVDKVLESSDFNTSFDESSSLTESLACSCDESSLTAIEVSS